MLKWEGFMRPATMHFRPPAIIGIVNYRVCSNENVHEYTQSGSLLLYDFLYFFCYLLTQLHTRHKSQSTNEIFVSRYLSGTFKRDPSALVSPTCKPEISNVDYDTFPAVCLWTGPDWDNPKPEAGWVNQYIQKKDQPKTRILAKVIEGCWFQGWFHGNYTTGCFAIAVSTAVMKKLAPTHVMDHMYIGPVVWDFVKNDGHQEVSGPV
ncbi:uncharacterized protein PGTG_11434 [Puccinia graminis f. sp. tritici CRL 75-36-700-3]|uniref:Uncharacterized protein n=1 Tax=Puccinia graminis f. sp. tritici (strain CRL 75-36-700-3 / race SCCL) TaxID=418459 RepID=E3KLR6_PUCGT|nr:uncharacterized protein PGTG_11434 [Puccinia graminis f. sp. tritici CRL 75-36-700-3]EFP85265.1 hypothetical protein PGTG_11434 [Puccinia graminis f. sp. tritici CRL 75-36-700-3]